MYKLCTVQFLSSPSSSVPSPHKLWGIEREINSLHRSLSRTTVEASAQDLNPNSSNSFCTVRHHVSFDLPLFLLPSCAQVRAVCGISSFSIHSTTDPPPPSLLHLSADELQFCYESLLPHCSLSSANMSWRFSKATHVGNCLSSPKSVMGTSKLLRKPDKMLGGNLRLK